MRASIIGKSLRRYPVNPPLKIMGKFHQPLFTWDGTTVAGADAIVRELDAEGAVFVVKQGRPSDSHLTQPPVTGTLEGLCTRRGLVIERYFSISEYTGFVATSTCSE
jgi:hypothetical protein